MPAERAEMEAKVAEQDPDEHPRPVVQAFAQDRRQGLKINLAEQVADDSQGQGQAQSGGQRFG